MSFVKTLATLAVGFAAAKGVQRFQQMGGLEGMKGALRDAGKPGGMAEQMGDWAAKMGVPGGKETVSQMLANFGAQAATATEAAQSNLGTMFGSMSAAAGAGAKGLGEMMSTALADPAVAAGAEAHAKLMIRAMIQAAKADGTIDAAEKAQILAQLGEASAEEVAFVQAELDAPIDIAGLVADVHEAARVQVYSAALMAITVDTEAERSYLSSLSAALALDPETVAQVHLGMGKPAP
ncbi:tellurite resistance TerB family protein [Rhodobacter capsulatus]|uniref:tellurite resistance TerB family protein n=1 Tax=Rhodobacter capsulatus TaxID=1061 RepID=UPI004025B884